MLREAVWESLEMFAAIVNSACGSALKGEVNTSPSSRNGIQLLEYPTPPPRAAAARSRHKNRHQFIQRKKRKWSTGEGGHNLAVGEVF